MAGQNFRKAADPPRENERHDNWGSGKGKVSSALADQALK
jgi:hypothetical protein